jgi:hypothetical protein
MAKVEEMRIVVAGKVEEMRIAAKVVDRGVGG